MKAMVFAAGLGTRLRPLTNDKPKALVPLNGVPMLERVLLNIKKCGINDVVVNVHHFGEQIIDFLKENENFGLNIAISDERGLLLDTGGGILKAKDFLCGNEPFLVHNADILTDLNLLDMIQAHIDKGADVTLLVKSRNTQRYLVLNDESRLIGWTNIATGEKKPTTLDLNCEHTKLAFGGVHVISPKIFGKLAKFSDEPKFSIIPFYISECKELKIYGYNPSNYNWFDIGKLETLQQAEAFLQSK